MTTICSPKPLPTLPDIYALLDKIDFKSALPAMPTMPSPLYPDVSCPSMAKLQFANELMMNQFFGWIKSVIDPMMNFVGAIPMPTVPELNLTLPQVVSLSPPDVSAAIAGIKLKLASIKPPMLPDPFMSGISSPSMEAVAKFQALIREYCAAIIGVAKTLMDMVADKLGKKPFQFGVAVPTLPELPTSFSGLMAPVLKGKSVDELLKSLPSMPSMSALFSVSPPGFAGMNLSLPTPWYSKMSAPALELVEISKSYYMAMVMFIAKKIDEFMELIKSFVPFSPPTLCVAC